MDRHNTKFRYLLTDGQT